MISLRPHDAAKADHPTDASGRTYITVDPATAETYVNIGRSEGQDIFIAGGTGVSDPAKIDMLFTETDSVGLEMPTTKHAPGY
jgi:hypothetical protein